MASNIFTFGHDLDTVFAPYVSGPKASTTGYMVGGVDICNRYARGSMVPTTNLTVSGADLSTFFQVLSGGPGDSGGDCVCDYMHLRPSLLARDAVPGDVFDCIDLHKRGTSVFGHQLHSVEHKIAPCVRITTDRGAVLDCSIYTPFDLLDGGNAWAPDMLGERVVTDLGIETVVRVEDIGTQRICHNHLGGLMYAAGADPLHRIFSHNPIIKH